MNRNFASNSRPVGPQQRDVPTRYTPIVDMDKDRRVIIIKEGFLTLNPSAYIVDSLYQALLMHNHKLCLCECFNNAALLAHSLGHFIHGWRSVMHVDFIAEDALLNQSLASEEMIVSASIKWLTVYAEMKPASRKITNSRLGKDGNNVRGSSTVSFSAPSFVTIAPNNNKLIGASSAPISRGKELSSSPFNDLKRKATFTEAKPTVSRRSRSKSPKGKRRKPAQSKKKDDGKVDRFVDTEQVFPKHAADTIPTSSNCPNPRSTAKTTTAFTKPSNEMKDAPSNGLSPAETAYLLEPFDFSCEPFDFSCLNYTDDFSEKNFRIFLALTSSNSVDKDNTKIAASPPHATDKQSTIDQDKLYSESAVEGGFTHESTVVPTTDEKLEKLLTEMQSVMADKDLDDLSLQLGPLADISPEDIYMLLEARKD